MTARYMLLDQDGDVVAEITDLQVLDNINQISGFVWKGKNYLYAHWLKNREYCFFQEAGKIVILNDLMLESRNLPTV